MCGLRLVERNEFKLGAMNLFRDANLLKGESTIELFRDIDETWHVEAWREGGRQLN